MARILIVEDNEMNRDMLSRRLERAGYTPLVAVSAFEGLARAKSDLPDLILMDLSLTDGDGRDLTRALKAYEPTRPIPVIALTAHAMAADKASALEAGCDEFETKPVDFARLKLKIEQLLHAAGDK
jgi:two-component system cell cycle response regulator DivK